MFGHNRGTFFAAGLVAGVALVLFFVVWSVPEFRNFEAASQYYENWIAAAKAGKNEKPDDNHFWLREFIGWVYTEDSLAQWIMAIVSAIATGVSLLAVFLVRDTLRENRRATSTAADAYAVDSTPFLILKPIKPQDVKFEGGALPHGVGCVVENTGRGPAEVTAIFRSWQCKPRREPPDAVDGVKKIGRWIRKEIQLPIGPSGHSPVIHSLISEHQHTGEKIGPDDWVYFLGYIEYKSALREDKFVSGFCYLLRPDEPQLGLHVAFTGNPKSYWYHRKL